jgi:alcohol dehydrogenase (NADP+)
MCLIYFISLDTPLILEEFPLKTWDEDTVEIDITHCSICSTDVHCINASWFPSDYPLVAGHEFTGTVTRVGKNVTHLKVGDRAGCGPMCSSCNKCETCLSGNENICENRPIQTYGDRFHGTNEKSFGGFADKWRGDKHWAFKIPDNLTNAEASSFLCAGITTFTPLKRWNVGPTSTVGKS